MTKIYLYVKTHAITGLKYLGKTESIDPHKYPGSGKYWGDHCRKHGKVYTTTILLMTENKQELKETGLFFSKLWNVAKSKEWVNFRAESGDGLDSAGATEENLRRVKEGNHPFVGPENNLKTKEKRNATIKERGNHNFKGGEIQKKAHARRVETGTQIKLNENNSKIKKNLAKENLLWIQNFIKLIDKNGNEHIILRSEYDKNDLNLVFINSIEGRLRANLPPRKKYIISKIVCPHCNVIGNISNMKRWHFDNCKDN